MLTDPFVNSRVSIWQQAGLLGLIAAFVAMGAMRLNDCDLFNPDSPRYVIYSQAIVNTGDYRATDVPGSPLYSWRPPGLPLLIAPVLAFRPYDVVAAKVVVLFTAALLLWVMFQLTSLHCGGWAALVMTGLIASGPTFLVLSTEVLSEIPYTLGVTTVLLIISRSTFRLPFARANMVVAIAAMAFTPWLRTAGVALVLAVSVWSVTSRLRLKWLSVAIAGVVGVGLLAWRNKQAGGENYVGSLFTRLRERGPGPIITSGLETISYYLNTIPGLLMPGLTLERTWYAPLTLDSLPKLGLPGAVAAVLAAVVVLLSMLGMWRRRENGGSLALLYVVIYCGCLVVWPWRHERFLWPLFPVLLAYLPAGFSSMAATGVQSCGKKAWGGVFVLLPLCAWQIIGSIYLVQINQEFVSRRDQFHSSRIPGFYFSDWRRAGTWLNANTPRNARVLTWHAAVAATSHRFQKRVQFETQSPEKIRQQIEAFNARYLVVPDGQFGDGFGWQQLSADPAIRLNAVYREHDVVVLEVEPNRTGEIDKTGYSQWLEQRMAACREAHQRLPDRIDIAIRNASLLNETGHTQEAIQALRNLLDHGTRTVRVCAELGWMLYESERFEEAAKYLDMARTLPNAESIASQLTDGVERAQARLREPPAPDTGALIERALNRVKSLMGGLKYAAAEREANRICSNAVDHPEFNFVRGKLHHRLGEFSQAAERYERAIQLGVTDAERWLLLIRFDQAISRDTVSSIEAGASHETVDPADPLSHVRLAGRFRDCVWPGRALATLEQANERFPDQACVQRPLADLYRLFARPDLAAPLYEEVLKCDSTDEDARKGLAAAKMALTEPEMDNPLRSLHH